MNCFKCGIELDNPMGYYIAVDEKNKYCCVDCYDKLIKKG